MRIVVVALCAASLMLGAPNTLAQSGPGGDPTTEGDGSTTGDPECQAVPEGGENGNSDVTVDNDSSSSTRPATVCPAGDQPDDTCTTVSVQTSFQGEVSGIDGPPRSAAACGDIINTESNACFTVNGTGGTVNLDAGSKVTVHHPGDGMGGEGDPMEVYWFDQNGDPQVTTITGPTPPGGTTVTGGGPPPP